MGKSRKWDSQDAKVVQVQSPLPLLTRSLCAAGTMLSWLLHPASCIPNPATSPDPFPSHPQGSVFLSPETFSNLDREKQVQSLSLAASPSLSQDTHVGDRSRPPLSPLTLECSFYQGKWDSQK